MALSQHDLAQIEAMLAELGVRSLPIAALRSKFPHLSWTCCDASDVAEDPFCVYGDFDVHLLDSTDHCAHMTSDPARATGIVLARRSAAP